MINSDGDKGMHTDHSRFKVEGVHDNKQVMEMVVVALRDRVEMLRNTDSWPGIRPRPRS